jgi:hypothetical protein
MIVRTVATLIACVFSIVGAQAQTIPIALVNAPSKALYHKDVDFTVDIARAKKLLEDKTVGYSTRPLTRPITKKVTKKDAKGKKKTTTQVVGHKFLVKTPPGDAVLAIKRVIRSGKSFKEVVYTPFSDEIDTPAMRARGMQILRGLLASAYDDVTKREVRSRAAPHIPLRELVAPEVALKLSLIEHIDPSRARREPIEKLMNEVLVIVAGNGAKAYAYSVSRAKARGLFQFIPRTYAAILRQYPRAGLIPDFVSGMDHHVNAAKASLLLFDSDLLALEKDRRLTLLQDPIALAEYLAVAYNSGSRRAVRAYRDGKIHTAGLPLETVDYVGKLRKVRTVLRQ